MYKSLFGATINEINKHINNQIYLQTNNQACTRQPQIKPCESACPVPIATHDHVVNFMNEMYSETILSVFRTMFRNLPNA